MKPSLDRLLPDAVTGAAHLGSGRLVTQVVLVISAVVIPRVMGVEDYGLYVSLLAVVAIMEVASSGGLPMVELRHLGPAWTRGDRETALHLGSSIWFGKLVLSVLGSGIVAIWLLLVMRGRGLTLPLIVSVAVYCLFRYLLEGARHSLVSTGSMKSAAWVELCRALATLAVVMALFHRFGLLGVFFALAGVNSVLLATAGSILLRSIPLSVFRARASALRRYSALSILTWVGAMAWTFQSQFAVSFLGTSSNLTVAAELGVVVSIFTAAQTALVSARAALLPAFATLRDSDRLDLFREGASRVLLWLVVATVALVTAWASYGHLFVLLLPVGFDGVYRSAVVVLIAMVPMTVGLVSNGLLYAADAPGVATLNRVVFAIVTIAGVIGLAFATDAMSAVAIAWCYVAGAVSFAAMSTIAVKSRLGIALPFARAVVLAIIGALATLVLVVVMHPGIERVLLGSVALVLLLAGAYRRGILTRL